MDGVFKDGSLKTRQNYVNKYGLQVICKKIHRYEEAAANLSRRPFMFQTERGSSWLSGRIILAAWLFTWYNGYDRC